LNGIGLIWLWIETSGGLLWTLKWSFGFHKMLGSSWVAAQLATSQEGLSSMSEWVSEYLQTKYPFFSLGTVEFVFSITIRNSSTLKRQNIYVNEINVGVIRVILKTGSDTRFEWYKKSLQQYLATADTGKGKWQNLQPIWLICVMYP
jgi:hypothetical protein